jgi:NTP pyrophosphatase (non-canonical NTP hydrolase)
VLEIHQLALFDMESHVFSDVKGPMIGAVRPRSIRQASRRFQGQLALPISPSVLVQEFQAAVGGVTSKIPTVNLSAPLQELRLALIREETEELAQAIDRQNLVAIADALGDIVYVTFGAALTYGIDLDAVLAEIHRSNMTKLDRDGRPILREDGKVLKGPDYSPPDLASVLSNQKYADASALKIIHVA